MHSAKLVLPRVEAITTSVSSIGVHSSTVTITTSVGEKVIVGVDVGQGSVGSAVVSIVGVNDNSG